MTRVGCEAAFRIGLNQKLEKWIVKEFRREHNHPLVHTIDTQFLWSHWVVSNPDKAQVNAMRKVSVKTTQIMDYMVQESRGREHVISHQKIYTIMLMQCVELKLKMVMWKWF